MHRCIRKDQIDFPTKKLAFRNSLSRVFRPLCQTYQRFTPSLSSKFGASFLQIPHWLPFTGSSLLRQIREVSSGTLAVAYIFPPFKGYGWTYTS